MELDQKSITIFLHLQGKTNNMIYNEMKEVLGATSVSYSSITRYIRNYIIAQNSHQDVKAEKINVHDETDKLILKELEEEPFASVRQIARTTGIPKSTVYRHLTEKLNYVNMHLKWIPHKLTTEQKHERVACSLELIKMLTSAENRGWNYFVTGDESWFYLNYEYEQKWVQSGEEPPTRVKRMISDEKVMITVFWNPNGFQVIDALPRDQTFNAYYYTNNILAPLSQMGQGFPDADGRRLTIHADNAKPHTARHTTQYIESHGMKKAPHPPYSPDIAPSDFFLFGYTKDKLQGCILKTRDQLFQKVEQIMHDIGVDVLHQVFAEWKRRLQIVIDTNGEYIQ